MKKEIAKRHADVLRNMPDNCWSGHKSLWSFLTSWLWSQNSECVRYFESVEIDPLWEVPPTKVSAQLLCSKNRTHCFVAGGHKRHTELGLSLFCLLRQVFFSLSFAFLVYGMFCFLVFGCQYQCNRLPGRTRLVSSGTLNPTHSATHSLASNAYALSYILYDKTFLWHSLFLPMYLASCRPIHGY